MHHSLLPLFLLLVIAFLVMRANRKRRQRSSCGCADKQLPPTLTAPNTPSPSPEAPEVKSVLPEGPQTPAENSESKLSQDEKVQLKQALALSQDVKSLEAEFAAIRSRLPATAAIGDAKAVATSREVAIAAEQLRIARSYSNELMRFVMAAYQSQAQGQYVPSFSDASWAFTAGHLTLSFARARIVTLC
jgi:hypothetical protein